MPTESDINLRIWAAVPSMTLARFTTDLSCSLAPASWWLARRGDTVRVWPAATCLTTQPLTGLRSSRWHRLRWTPPTGTVDPQIAALASQLRAPRSGGIITGWPDAVAAAIAASDSRKPR